MVEKKIILSESDEELVRRVRTGSTLALEQLLRRYERRLFLFIRRRVGREQDAEDILQETFIKALRYLDRFDEHYHFCSWIYTITNQQIITHYRQRKDEALPDDVPMCAESPGDLAERDSLKEKLWHEASKLPPKQFDVIWLRYVEDMSIHEVAKALSMTGINVRVLLHRARLALVKSCASFTAHVPQSEIAFTAKCGYNGGVP